MLTVRLNEYVSAKGIFIPFEKVKDLKDKLVEITISPLISHKVNQTQPEDFMRFAGAISENDAD